MARRILGLDMGSHAIKAVELRQTLRELEVVQLRSLPLGLPAPSLGDDLRHFLEAHDLPTEHVVVSLAGDRLSTRRLQFPFRDRRRIAPAVPFEIEAQVPFDLEDYVVDWQLGRDGREQTEVLAALAPRAEVVLLLETLAEAGIDPRCVEAEGPVLGNLAELAELQGTRLLVDLGHRKSTFCLLVEGRPAYARTIPIGGEAITQALAKEQGLHEDEAERWKIENGIFGGGGAPDCPGAISVVDRLTRELLRTLGTLESIVQEATEEEPVVDEVTLLGATAHLHRLDEVLAERSGLRVSRLRMGGDPAASAIVAGGDPLVYGHALALALRGSTRARTALDFRQGDLAPRLDFGDFGRQFRPTAILAAVAALLLVLGFAARIGVESQRAEALERQAASLYQQAFPGRPPPGNVVSAMQQAVGAARDRAETLGVYRGNLSALDILTEISARVPEDVDVVFEEVSIDRQIVQIKGHTPGFGSVDRLRRELGQFEPFSQITVGDITQDSKRGGQNFNMRISLEIGGGS